MELADWKILTVVLCIPAMYMWVRNRAGDIEWMRWDWPLAFILGGMFVVLSL